MFPRKVLLNMRGGSKEMNMDKYRRDCIVDISGFQSVSFLPF